jgi:hypothetical protein
MPRSRPPDSPFQRSIAGGCAVLVLALAVLAACPALHAWLHGEKHLDPNDHCAVVLALHGITPAEATLIIAAVAVLVRILAPAGPAALLLAEPRFRCPPACGPPRA